MRIFYSTRFEKDFRRIPKNIQERVVERGDWFRSDPFDSRLKTHALKGELSGLHSFSVNNSYRILFKFSDDMDFAKFLRVGQHDIYDYH